MLTFPPAMQFNGQCRAAADVVDIGFSNTVVASRVSSLHDAAIIVTFSSVLLLHYLHRLPSSRIHAPCPVWPVAWQDLCATYHHLCTNSICALQFRETLLHITSELRQAIHKNLHSQQHIILEPNWDSIDERPNWALEWCVADHVTCLLAALLQGPWSCDGIPASLP